MKKALTCVLFLVLLLAMGRSALAQRRPRTEPRHPQDQPVASPQEESAKHLQRAGAAAAARDWHRALTEYYAANAVSQNLIALEGIAIAYDQLGQEQSAIDAYKELLTAMGTKPPPDPASQKMWTRMKSTADQRLAELVAHRGAIKTPDTEPHPLPPPPAPPPSGADPRMWEEHGLMVYTAARTATPPSIDGVLDDAIWKVAPVDDRFRDVYSKPYGMPVSEPTAVQVAYDDDYLYVAFQCRYGKPGPRDDTFPRDENAILDGAERVSVNIDARHDHSNARLFGVSRTGSRIDSDITQNGDVANLDWRGIWEVATRIQGDAWFAEFKIPWATVGLPSHDEEFVIGIDFFRFVSRAGMRGAWALPPPAPGIAPISKYGHLAGLSNVHPGKRLYLQPFAIGAYRSDRSTPLSRLRDFSGTNGNLGVYGGFYARYRPVAPLQIDITANPDFSQAPPDPALANLDRFELVFPETRLFFSEDRARFELGTDNAQLFYSRRVGLQPAAGSTSVYTELPVIYAGKSVVRASGTEASVMNVGVSTPDPKVTVADDITVARVNHLFGSSRRVGSIFLHRSSAKGEYMATGVDAATSFMNENLVLSGFLAESATSGQSAGAVGFADLHWDSADFEARLSYLDVQQKFDPQLGYFQQTGVRTVTALGGYTPIVRNDYVYEIDLRVQAARSQTQDDLLVYNRASLSFEATMINRSQITVSFLPSTEGVLRPFTIAGGRETIPVGRYDVKDVQLVATSPPGRTLVVSAGYTEGDLFFGYQRTPQMQVGLNVGRFSTATLYKLYLLRIGGPPGSPDRLVGHQVSSRLAFVFTPTARSTLAIEANTLDPRATVQFITSVMFGELSNIALVLLQTAPSVDLWFTQPVRSALLSLGYGFSVL